MSRYADVTATLALIVALSGTAYAATKIDSHDIANGQVKRADLGKNAVTTGKVENGTLLAKDFKAGQLPAGARGATGAPGPKGDKGDVGPVGATTPVAVVNVKEDGTLRSETHRAPVTGAPTVTHTTGSGYYYVHTPGVRYDAEQDAAICSPLYAADYQIGTSDDGSGTLLVAPRFGGALTDAPFSCAIYDLKN